ncbi:dephospho-CoA kinase [Corynebacterium sp. CCM 9185]|uniref:Dephospho-CoA kinase n=1 Tax=Corynebacterium marambiense TaxID=2765364 RepID=A0ABS0VU96_9CORY|nr:dephospho-CoA kinase [Corynebacterium marambiense]MBI9000328.1 dephospho-CoA kinase [Corynebacterium marambiense]MCK7663681.1 dephospho-CoA kinase [Corynebacterium marambiense]MCX7541884.1 dephospho-CoA kinase [Corynebacterium marambiense]
MLRIGLTGGIGSGKSTVAAALADLDGVTVIDADAIARDIVEPGQPALEELAREFGSDILQADGTLDRKLLAERAFSDDTATERLNAIMHPRIIREASQRLDTAERNGAVAGVYDMPLLFETGQADKFDTVIVVDVDSEERVRRLKEHRGIDAADARRRMAAQIGDEERRSGADIIIDNNGPLTALELQVKSIVAPLIEAERRRPGH